MELNVLRPADVLSHRLRRALHDLTVRLMLLRLLNRYVLLRRLLLLLLQLLLGLSDRLGLLTLRLLLLLTDELLL